MVVGIHTDDAMRQVADAVKRIRRNTAEMEFDLHQAVSSALTALGIEHAHEVKLAPGRRIDILCQNGVGIEIKKGLPSMAALKEQLARYLACDEVRGILVVSERSALLPKTISGKPVINIALSRLWGVALH